LILLIDNYDSFTYNLVDYFNQLGEECLLYENDNIPDHIDTSIFKGAVLSPGPGTPDEANGLMSFIQKYERHIPMLGICLGHQAIGTHFGARLQRAIKPMHGKISVIRHKKESIFYQVPDPLNVVRYHSLVCGNLPDQLRVIAITDDNELMAVKHRELPIWGIQFHPEAALTEHGLKLLDNWLKAIS